MKTAVVLFNLGGPDSVKTIRPFLYKLFADKRIIDLPAPLRQMIALLISTTRTPKVKPLYALMGGGSPILANTQAQADGLQKLLGNDYKIFIAMRYSKPRAAEAVKQIKKYAPEKIILLPLYPQFSTTTTESSLAEWNRAAKGLNIPTEAICCYPTEPGFIDAMAEMLQPQLRDNNPRVLFSAHGLPQKIIDKKNDPYVQQVEKTAQAIVAKLGIPNLDWKVTYQSRVGPVEWVKPYTDAEIRSAGAGKKHLVIVPIAFVSEHIETLVELDVENKHLAETSGCASYKRIPTVSTHPKFIAGLAELVRKPSTPNHCSKQWFACPCKK